VLPDHPNAKLLERQTMSLKDEIEALAKERNHRGGCAWKALCDKLPPEDLKALEAAINKGISTKILVTALRREGYKTSNDSYVNHKRGNCSCAK